MTRSKKSPTKKKTVRAPKAGKTTQDVATNDAAAPKTAPAPRGPKALDPRIPPAGTVIERPYKGKALKLKVLDAGFEFAGKEFSSLSAAARTATGAASINGLLFWKLIPDAAAPKSAKSKAPAAPKIGGETNDFATPAGQRAALAALGIAKKGRPISKPRGDATATAKPAKGE